MCWLYHFTLPHNSPATYLNLQDTALCGQWNSYSRVRHRYIPPVLAPLQHGPKRGSSHGISLSDSSHSVVTLERMLKEVDVTYFRLPSQNIQRGSQYSLIRILMHELAQLNAYCYVPENKLYVVEDNIKVGLTVTFYVYEDRMTSSAFTQGGRKQHKVERNS